MGEWTAAAYDCAGQLPGITYTPTAASVANNIGSGSFYDGTLPGSTTHGDCSLVSGDGSTFSAAYKVQLRKYFEVQTTTYEKYGNGWIMWT